MGKRGNESCVYGLGEKEIGRALVELGVNLVIIDEHKTLTYNGMFD